MFNHGSTRETQSYRLQIKILHLNRFCFVSFETFPIHISGLFSHGDPGKGRCVSKIAVLWANNGEHAKNGHFWHFIGVKFPVSDFQ